MSLLFTIENKVVRPTTEVLLIPLFKEIWERDTQLGKPTAIKEFTYMEFMASVKKTNPYRGYSPEVRAEKLALDIMEEENYIPDDLMKTGMQAIEVFQKEASSTYSYYLSAFKAAKKLEEFFNTFDIREVNFKTGTPLYKPKDITSALNDTERVLQNLITIEEKVNNELFESTKVKGQKIVSVFANPDTL